MPTHSDVPVTSHVPTAIARATAADRHAGVLPRSHNRPIAIAVPSATTAPHPGLAITPAEFCNSRVQAATHSPGGMVAVTVWTSAAYRPSVNANAAHAASIASSRTRLED